MLEIFQDLNRSRQRHGFFPPRTYSESLFFTLRTTPRFVRGQRLLGRPYETGTSLQVAGPVMVFLGRNPEDSCDFGGDLLKFGNETSEGRHYQRTGLVALKCIRGLFIDWYRKHLILKVHVDRSKNWSVSFPAAIALDFWNESSALGNEKCL